MAVVFSGMLFCRTVSAQQIIGAIVTADLPRYQQAHQAMIKVLQSGGFGEDKVKIFTQSPNADKMSLVNSLRRFEAAGATIVLTAVMFFALAAIFTEVRKALSKPTDGEHEHPHAHGHVHV